jgi:hypothetical protein
MATFLLALQLAGIVIGAIEALLTGPNDQTQTTPPIRVTWGGHVFNVDLQVTKVA